jgi:hypothetical protein
MRLIDADALADALFEKRRNYPQWVADTIGKMPDAIVRCKDCKHGEPSIVPLSDNYYCKHQERVHKPEWFCADGVMYE